MEEVVYDQTFILIKWFHKVYTYTDWVLVWCLQGSTVSWCDRIFFYLYMNQNSSATLFLSKVHSAYCDMLNQRELNRWSQFSEQKLRFFSNAFDKKWWAYRVYIRQKNWGGCHHLLLVYDASKLITVYVVKSPVLGLQRAFFQKS